MKILCKQKDAYFVGKIHIDGILFIKNQYSVDLPISDGDKLWILDNDGIQETTKNNLISLIKPLFDMHGQRIEVGDYIASLDIRNDTLWILKIKDIKCDGMVSVTRVYVQGDLHKDKKAWDHLHTETIETCYVKIVTGKYR